MCDKKKKEVKNGSPRPLTPPASENIPYADDYVSNEDLVNGVYGKWMQVPSTSIKCAPGLEYLSILDKLFIVQEPKIVEALTGYEECNKYGVLNELGENVYYAVEENDCFLTCGPMRPFQMKILNSSADEVMSFNRPIRCQTCCCPCFLQELEVMAPPGTTIGYVKQEWSISRTKFSIQNAEGKKVLKILGPCCFCRCCCDINFKVYSMEGKNVGKISKKYWNLPKEIFSDIDLFGISFPMDLDVSLKAVMLGACILICNVEKQTANQLKKSGMLLLIWIKNCIPELDFNDPPSWPPLTGKIRCYLIEHGPDQGKHADFNEGKQCNRCFNKYLNSNEVAERTWLMYPRKTEETIPFSALRVCYL